ncbi:MAG: hypothetical protein KA248_10865 [Kiritimatiellae bacterium]|nr:hypothetical protein [Kiritimatiellia bacterium]
MSFDDRIKKRGRGRVLGMLLVLLAGGVSPEGAVIYTAAWDATDDGWVGRDSVAGISFAGGFGDPAGSMLATFAEQGIPAAEVDAFRATASASGGAFTGDYWADLGEFYGWTFRFYAATELPSDLQVRFRGSSGPALIYNALPQLGGVGSWYTITVPATYSGNWFGGTETAWSNALASVQWVDIQIGRSGSGAEESYYLDGFRHSEDDPDPPDPPDPSNAVPEPTPFVLVLAAALVLRRRWRRADTARGSPIGI